MTTAATVIKMSIQRMACSQCGAEANASCNCGVSYIPKSLRAAEAITAHPEKSDRAIAADIGVAPNTVKTARDELRSTAQLEDAARIGLDGKARKLPERKPEDARVGTSNLRNAFLINCAATVQIASSYEGPTDNEIRAAARRAADAWSTLADVMEGRTCKMPPLSEIATQT